MTAAPLRVFVSTGEASGELLAADLLGAMRAAAYRSTPTASAANGSSARACASPQRNAGWASMGPLDALGKIPKLLTRAIAHGGRAARASARPDRAGRLRRVQLAPRAHDPRARLARRRSCTTSRRRRGSTTRSARARSRRVCDPLTAFAHQRDFYRSLGLPIGYVGHPLVSTIAPRPRAPAGAGRRRRRRAACRAAARARSRATRRGCSTRSRCLRERRPDITRGAAPPIDAAARRSVRRIAAACARRCR